MSINIITNEKELKNAIDSIARRGKKLDNDIQVAACSVIAHVAEHGNNGIVNKLINAMPKGSRLNALKAFIDKYGPVYWDEENKEFKYDREKPLDLEGAIADHWTDFKPDPPYKAFSLNARLEKLCKDAIKRAKSGDERDDINPQALEGLTAFARSIGVVIDD